MVKLQFPNRKQYMLTLPKKLVEAIGWEMGDEIRVRINDNGNIVLLR